MVNVVDLHEWDLSPFKARQLQENLRDRIILKPLRKKVQFVAGLDCSLDKRAGRIFAAAVVFKFSKPLPGSMASDCSSDLGGMASREAKAMGKCDKPRFSPSGSNRTAQSELSLVETAGAQLPLSFPYVPGLLSFREIPVCLEAAKKVQTPVDLWLIDGQGLAHPRRLGLASHLGLFLNAPTIGCAKSRLIGTYEEPGKNKGDFSWLYDKEDKIGAVVRTRDNVKPLFISQGHLCSFEDAINYTLACTTKYRLPEPTRIAHQTVSRIKLS